MSLDTISNDKNGRVENLERELLQFSKTDLIQALVNVSRFRFDSDAAILDAYRELLRRKAAHTWRQYEIKQAQWSEIPSTLEHFDEKRQIFTECGKLSDSHSDLMTKLFQTYEDTTTSAHQISR